jgi:predicted 3-demethylubiquinone-9 3-methyltransferase (glyoxalase superfamily)
MERTNREGHEEGLNMKNISTCLWFDNQSEEAVKFYASLFKNSKIKSITRYGKSGAEVAGQKEGNVMTVDFEIGGQEFMALNGGPEFKPTPAISFFVWCENEKEIDGLWGKLSSGGTTLMELNKYPFAEKYGWCEDRYGVSWQVIHAPEHKKKQKITPAFLFVKEPAGRAEEAMGFYISTFKKGKIESIARDESSKAIMHAVFNLAGQEFVAMESFMDHDFTFSLATSFVVNCENQKEVDEYWEKLSAGGSKSQCGWLQDKFGVAWQVVPTVLSEMMRDKNPAKVENVMTAMLQMTKLDINKLKQAYERK